MQSHGYSASGPPILRRASCGSMVKPTTNLISHEGMSRDAFRMCLFPHTLKEGAKIWMISQPLGSIVSWNDMVQKFTMKFFPLSRVHQIRNEVYLFRQKDHETYLEAWDRFKSAFRKCPNLDVPKLAQIYVFYNGLRGEFCNIVDASAGGSILTIEVDDAHNLFERIAENQANWLTDREAPRKAARLHNVDAVTALATQMEVITKKLDTLTQSVHMVQHPAHNYQRQNGSYPYNYHPGLNKYPNYLWVDNPDQASKHNIENQVGQIAATLANRPQGTLPSDREKNPREQVLAVEVVNYVTIELPSTRSTIPVKAYVPPIPFPQRLQRQLTAEKVQAITTRSGVQLPEIIVKRKETEKTQMPTKDKKPMEQSEEEIEKDQQTVLDNPQL
ncbi:uncharacterized protein LOC111406521 [Olea europaea var. sylvestris]|uniref:uncharacterized protein LOC111406521 n=1 Tax=Olea europaea var. sylvestris TaxID=158386 RepID=UPI000C1CD3D8|nr:uncharacterized protein LOC111406521 [Olea europaea var. sylvestris]